MSVKDPSVCARLYHLNSSNFRSKVADLSLDMDRRPRRFRSYPGSKRIDLPAGNFDLDTSFGAVLQKRRSIREFSLDPLPLSKVSQLLFLSYGVKGLKKVEGEWMYERPVPSAGGLYPLELYLVGQQIEGIDDGIYHYDPRTSQLELLKRGLFHSQMAELTIGQEMIVSANMVIAISGIFERTMWKYGERGYRYVFLDAGHVGQNIYLSAIALGLGPVTIGGFFDQEVNSLLHLPPNETVIYLACVGQPKAADSG